MSPQPSRFRGLDGLRGLAALVVLVHHVLLCDAALAQAHRAYPGDLSGPVKLLAYSPLHLAWAGAEAVLVFFVLSGLVLSAGPLSGPRPRGTWVEYYPRRVVRLYLPVVGALALALLQARWLRHSAPLPDASWVYNAHVGSGTVHNAVRDATLLHEKATFLDGPLWSLHWEVLFSLALPAYLLLARRRVGQALAVVVGLLALTALGQATGRGALTFLPVFGLGVVVAGVLPQAQALARRCGWWLLLPAGLLLTATWSLRALRPGQHLDRTEGAVAVGLVSLGALLLVLAFLDGRAAEWAAGTPWVRWLGRRSFSLYLVHAPIVVSVAFLLGGTPSVAVLGLIAVPLSLLAAEAFGRYVEEPAHRLSRRAGVAAVGAWSGSGRGRLASRRLQA